MDQDSRDRLLAVDTMGVFEVTSHYFDGSAISFSRSIPAHVYMTC